MTQGFEGTAGGSAAARMRRRHASAGGALLLALGLACCAPAWAINKCVVDGKTVYQDAPCEEERETVAQSMERKERNEMLHRKLDMLAAQGQGMVQRAPSQPRQRERTPVEESPRPRTRAEMRAEQARVDARIREETERNNAEATAQLTRYMDEVTKQCGGPLVEQPRVGMTDENFRMCTVRARFGGITQVVVSEDGKVPLRLYISPTGPGRRVYTIGGVVTAVRD